MRVSTLYSSDGPLQGKDVYIVGHGPSMAIFPINWLQGRLCILLNDVQKYFPRLGPIAFANAKEFIDPISPSIRYSIVKGRMKHDGGAERDDNHVHWDDPSIYVFSYHSPEWGEVDSRQLSTLWQEPDYYWTGGTVACFAVQFAAQAGAQTIFLVGCDCVTLYGKHYHIDGLQKQRKPNSRAIVKSLARRGIGPPRPQDFVRDYAMYEESLLIIKRETERKFKIPVLTLSPFIGVKGFEKQFRDMMQWK